ncbi:hypothetical protein DDZ14_02915 [Maritimibacter sp. 55A14]|nr:hypothetical protein DDZ14_02915 [Maritimibacter sp. 55A14]
MPYFPTPPATVLDVGSGSGRDAIHLAKKGFHVLAVEPSKRLLEIAQSKCGSNEVSWLSDRLPSLDSVRGDRKFDFILCSAVLMHLPSRNQILALKRLSELCANGAVLYLTFRSSGVKELSEMYEVDKTHLINKAASYGLRLKEVVETSDWCGRTSIAWWALIFVREN